MKNQPTKIITCLVAGFILSACVGAVNIDGTDGNGSGNIPSGNIPSGTILTEHVSDGVASLNVTGRADCVIRGRGDTPYASGCGITADLSRDTFSRTRGGSNPILRVDGINYEFDKDDAITRATGSGFISGEGYRNRFGRVIIVGDTSGFAYYNTRERLEYQARNGAGIARDYISDIYTPGDTVGFATFGTKIAVDNLSLKGTYSAEGQFNLDTYNHFTEHFITKEVVNQSGGYQGDLTLTVNFDANTVSGTADNFKYYGNGTTQDIRGTASFVSADIVGSGFAGDLTFNRAFHQSAGFINTINAKYAGDFFGDGDVLAGVVQFASASIADRNVLGIGGFRAAGEVTTVATAEAAERTAEVARMEEAAIRLGAPLVEQPATAIWPGRFEFYFPVLGLNGGTIDYQVDFSAGTFEFYDVDGNNGLSLDWRRGGPTLYYRMYGEFGNQHDFLPGQLGGYISIRYDRGSRLGSPIINGYIGEQGADGVFTLEGGGWGNFVATNPGYVSPSE